jgi:hypothetical protein
MSSIIIGKSGSKNVTLDLDVLLRTRMLVQANSGKGKSWLLRRLAEQLFGKTQTIIIDPEGEFATLREKFGFVLVGKGGETPADVRSASLVAHKLLELRASAVCDIYELKPATRHEWVQRFLDALIDAPKNLWHPCVIMVDEAHAFCPEKGSGESLASDSLIGLATRGRKRGFASIFATQRLGKLRKDAAAELLNVMIGGTFIDIDRKRAADALGVYGTDQRKFFDEIKVLDRGTFYALGPAISNERILVKVGAVETTHPEAGSSKHAAEPPPTPEKVRAMLPKLADLPRTAEEKAQTESELRKQIRELRGQLRSQPTQKVQPAAADSKAIERNVTFGSGTFLKNALTKYRQEIARDAAQRNAAIRKLERALSEIHAKSEGSLSIGAIADRPLPAFQEIPRGAVGARSLPASVAGSIPAPRSTHTPAAHIPPVYEHAESSDGEISRKHMDILRALAEFAAIGKDTIPKKWVAARAGASHKSSAFDNNVSRLKTLGLIQYAGQGNLKLTPEGTARAPNFPKALSSDELLEGCLKLLNRKQQLMLRALHEAYPCSIPKPELAERSESSATSSAFDNNVSAMRSAGMVDYIEGGVKAAEWLFLE